MAGIYIHIPFCKQACHYCDFHFSTNLKLQGKMVEAIKQELTLQKSYLANEVINSIYIGGGTPSLLEIEEIGSLIHHVKRLFNCKEEIEVTLEANPDDIVLEKLLGLKNIGINRLSIGIQTFDDTLLKYLNRAHDSARAKASLEMVLEAGFKNFSIDLIYAIPAQSEEMLKQDLAIISEFHPSHISAYCLTIESNTAFGRWLEKGKIKAVDEEIAANHFNILATTLIMNNYEHYEISNFSLPNYQAQHNTNYWKRGTYLGVGPGAHSYNGISRQYNISNNPIYIERIQEGIIPSTIEILRPQDHINEYIMTNLRTKWGCDMIFLNTHYGYDLLTDHHIYIEKLILQDLAYLQENKLLLTRSGKLLADKIAADLFVA